MGMGSWWHERDLDSLEDTWRDGSLFRAFSECASLEARVPAAGGALPVFGTLLQEVIELYRDASPLREPSAPQNPAGAPSEGFLRGRP